jgi:hypothetical protein
MKTVTTLSTSPSVKRFVYIHLHTDRCFAVVVRSPSIEMLADCRSRNRWREAVGYPCAPAAN